MEKEYIFDYEYKEFEIIVKKYISSLRDIFPEILKTKNSLKSNVVLFNYLERFLYNWEGLLKITPEFERTFNYNYPVALIARGVIIDCVSTVYLMNLIKVNPERTETNEEECLKACNAFDHDYMRAIMKLLDEADLDENKRNEVRKDYYETFKEGYPTFFKVEGEKVTFNSSEKVADIKRIGIDNMFSALKDTKIFKQGYFIYKYYSQFQHCSRFTKELLYKFHRLNFSNLVDTFHYTLYASWLTFHVFNINPKYAEAMDVLTKEVNEYKAKYFKEEKSN